MIDGFTQLLQATGVVNIAPANLAMMAVCLGLIWLAIKKDFEPIKRAEPEPPPQPKPKKSLNLV